MTTPINNNAGLPGDLKSNLTIKVLGVGGAGGNLVEHLARQEMQDVTFIALNTDAHALANCNVPEKLVLGAKITRGLGAGADPDLARVAAKDDLEKCKLLFSGTDLVFLLTGLGGGTGTGASPVIAQAARDAGALVLAIVTLPFDFEGSRRQRQAQLGLRDLKVAADAVICLPNQRIFKLIDGKTSFLDTFKLTNEMVASAVRGVWRMLTQPGLIGVDFADLCAVARSRRADSCFATVEASGEDRSDRLAKSLIGHPLFEGDALKQADSLLVSVVGGLDLAMSEVDGLMQTIKNQAKGAQLIFGAAIDEAFQDRVCVTLIVSRECDAEDEENETTRSRIPSEADTDFHKQPAPRPVSRFTAPAPELSDETKQQIITQKGRGGRSRKKANIQQGQLPLEIVTRGRFEKSEPTIHHGEDLDVPTYIRRGIALN